MINIDKELKEMVEMGLIEFGKNEDGKKGYKITKKGIEEAERIFKK